MDYNPIIDLIIFAAILTPVCLVISLARRKPTPPPLSHMTDYKKRLNSRRLPPRELSDTRYNPTPTPNHKRTTK